MVAEAKDINLKACNEEDGKKQKRESPDAALAYVK